ncbi:hypothetical protein OJAV_G00124870 [Oryzias javanicus]|uniref:Uncharacterized protein n=1 Tax=Oryzias javanicus TaxID=123683 RepID=A0A437CUZ1_ORYJA|nr:hypothetical protein OJAV_G00124870 [Oryzias javanicus]
MFRLPGDEEQTAKRTLGGETQRKRSYLWTGSPSALVTIPRAKLHPSDEGSTVIANPMALSSNEKSYTVSSSAHQEPYTVKEDGGVDEERGGCRACCYRCRRRK